jgi:excisionase family DNA binding protein
MNASIEKEGGTLTTTEVACVLRVSKGTVYNWVRAGHLKALQYGRRYVYRFDPDQVRNFCKDR